MMFYYVPVKEVYGHDRISSDKYHKNGECPCLSDSRTVIISGKMNEGFEPCGVCYDE